MSKFHDAKRIIDYYMRRLGEDKENPQAVFTLQTAQLKLMRYQTINNLNALESYPIDVEITG